MPHIRKVDSTILTPIKWDRKINGKYVRTVYFENRFFKAGENMYELFGCHIDDNEHSKDYGDCIHYVKNIATGERREVSGASIRQWIENE